MLSVRHDIDQSVIVTVGISEELRSCAGAQTSWICHIVVRRRSQETKRVWKRHSAHVRSFLSKQVDLKQWTSQELMLLLALSKVYKVPFIILTVKINKQNNRLHIERVFLSHWLLSWLCYVTWKGYKVYGRTAVYCMNSCLKWNE